MSSEKEDIMLIRPARRARPLVLGFLTVALLYFAWSPLSSFIAAGPLGATFGMPCIATTVADKGALVPLEAHIMSKCPDARDCLRMLVLPTMQRAYEKVNFTMSFIGT